MRGSMFCLVSQIKKSCAEGKWQDVLLHYQSLRRAGIQVTDISAFPPILKACLNLSLSSTYGASFHASLLKLGFAEAFAPVGNSIVDFYSKSGRLGASVRAFQSLAKPDSVSWNVIIHAHLHQGASPREGLRLFDQARAAGFQPNVSALVLVFQTCRNLASFHHGQKIHSFLVRSGFGTVCSVQNSLLSFYAELRMELAWELFDEMSERDVVSWSVVIGGLVGSGDAALALELFKEMLCDWGIRADDRIVVSVLKGCSLLGDIRMGSLVHGLVTSRGLGQDLFVGNSLVDMYSKCNDMGSALQAFGEIPLKNTVSWNSLLYGLVQSGNHGDALLLFDSMGKSGAEADEVTLVNLLQVCKHLGDPYPCKLIHSRIFRLGYEWNELVMNSVLDAYARHGLITLVWRQFSSMGRRDAVTWSTMIAAFTNQGMPDEAFDVFQEMCSKSVKPNAITLLNLLEACSITADLRRSMWAHAIAIRRCVASEVAVGTAILDMYSKCGAIEASRKVFECIHCKNIISWSAMIAAFGMNGLSNDALACFNEMKLHGLKPNQVTLLSVLSACSHGGLIENGISLFKKSVHDLEGELEAEHYSCLIDLLARAGKVESAREIIERLPQDGKKPGKSAWYAILSACRIHENNEIGFGVLPQLLELEPTNTSACSLASSMYAFSHLWTDATRMRWMMNDRKGTGTEGAYSLLRIDGRTCKFFAGNNRSSLPDKLCLAIAQLHSCIKFDCGV
ncbi:unnamed protein product [Cuscuta campestris]|uniref:Pentacotripeptide-repeat region of PRORP domain-containing protein n=1 Tax=Cuscuta campestris TaxID=132261 RepID=A0A484LR86_9ASTE|nr:unnamed protein product [Cuscuta campestris]